MRYLKPTIGVLLVFLLGLVVGLSSDSDEQPINVVGSTTELPPGLLTKLSRSGFSDPVTANSIIGNVHQKLRKVEIMKMVSLHKGNKLWLAFVEGQDVKGWGDTPLEALADLYLNQPK